MKSPKNGNAEGQTSVPPHSFPGVFPSACDEGPPENEDWHAGIHRRRAILPGGCSRTAQCFVRLSSSMRWVAPYVLVALAVAATGCGPSRGRFGKPVHHAERATGAS